MVRVRRFRSFEVIALAAVLALVYGHQASLDAEARELFDERFGAVPVDLWSVWSFVREHGPTRDAFVAASPLLTANFLHADLMHLGGNLLFFWIFGNVVSQVAGRAAFVALFLLSGILAVLVYVRTNPGSEIPMLGASGAIAGLEGAYFILLMRWELPYATVWPLDGPQPPARLALVAVASFALDASAFFGHAGGPVAYGAHVGGFVGGGLLAMALATVKHPQFRA